jgi:rod shape-determining protein MreC
LLWLALFAGVSTGATVADSRQLLDVPRQAAARVAAPLQSGASRIGRAAGALAAWSAAWGEDVDQLRRENAALRGTVEELLQETVRMRAAELENRELREQLRYAQGYAQQALRPAEVIGFDSSALLGHVVIDRGREAQLEDGMPVLSTAGLVGRIVATTARTSTVLLINHPSSSVNAMVQGSPGATGVLTGQPDGRPVMRYLPQAEPVRPDDLIVTSGLGGAFPRDLPIGRVVQVGSRDVDVFQQATVEPFVDVRRLRHVLVAADFVPAHADVHIDGGRVRG